MHLSNIVYGKCTWLNVWFESNISQIFREKCLIFLLFNLLGFSFVIFGYITSIEQIYITKLFQILLAFLIELVHEFILLYVHLYLVGLLGSWSNTTRCMSKGSKCFVCYTYKWFLRDVYYIMHIPIWPPRSNYWLACVRSANQIIKEYYYMYTWMHVHMNYIFTFKHTT